MQEREWERLRSAIIDAACQWAGATQELKQIRSAGGASADVAGVLNAADRVSEQVDATLGANLRAAVDAYLASAQASTAEAGR